MTTDFKVGDILIAYSHPTAGSVLVIEKHENKVTLLYPKGGEWTILNKDANEFYRLATRLEKIMYEKQKNRIN